MPTACMKVCQLDHRGTRYANSPRNSSCGVHVQRVLLCRPMMNLLARVMTNRGHHASVIAYNRLGTLKRQGGCQRRTIATELEKEIGRNTKAGQSCYKGPGWATGYGCSRAATKAHRKREPSGSAGALVGEAGGLHVVAGSVC